MAASSSSTDPASPFNDFLVQNEFLVRRLHSFTGLLAGGFMCAHLAVNASVVNSPETFQNNVYGIHALGKILPLVEWVFIFAPLLFHAVVGVWIANNAALNAGHYRYESNLRYTAQRITGYILFAYVLYHVFHMHGWFHFDWWLALAEPLGGHEFRPYNATSTAGLALRNWLVVILYAIGILSGAFHFANGVWTAGITWGLWTSESAQRGALKVCMGLSVLLAIVGLTGLFGMRSAAAPESLPEVQAAEERMYHARVEAGSVIPNEHKLAKHGAGDEHEAGDGKGDSQEDKAEETPGSEP